MTLSFKLTSDNLVMHIYILNVQLDRVIFSCILDLLGRLIGNFLFDIVHKCTHFNWFTVKHKLICLLYKQRGKKELKKHQLDR